MLTASSVAALPPDAPSGVSALDRSALAVAQDFDLPPCSIDDYADNCQILKRMSSNFADDFESVDLGDAGDFHWIRLFRFRLTLFNLAAQSGAVNSFFQLFLCLS